jgi:adenosylmethionine-8-amino-7-oxononanoate aminotransferase
MGITAANEKVVKPFQENSYARTFYHGHSFTANPLACAAAIASLDLIEESGFPEKVALIAELQRIFARKVHAEYPMLEARHLGTVFALTLKAADGLDYTHPLRHKIYAWFMEKDILLRPIGNVMYMVPPYCMESDQLEKVHDAILEFLEEIHRG